MVISSLKENLFHLNIVWDCVFGGKGEGGRGLSCFLDDFLNIILDVMWNQRDLCGKSEFSCGPDSNVSTLTA